MSITVFDENTPEILEHDNTGLEPGFYDLMLSGAVELMLEDGPGGLWEFRNTDGSVSATNSVVLKSSPTISFIDPSGNPVSGDYTVNTAGQAFEVFNDGNDNVYRIDLITTEDHQQTQFDLIDDDTFATATASNVPSAESVKAYVDAYGGKVEVVTTVADLLAVDTTDFNGTEKYYIRETKELVLYRVAAKSGDYAPTNGPGRWLSTAQQDGFSYATRADTTEKTYGAFTTRDSFGNIQNIASADQIRFGGNSYPDTTRHITGGSFSKVVITGQNLGAPVDDQFLLRVFRNGGAIASFTVTRSDFDGGQVAQEFDLGFTVNTADGNDYSLNASWWRGTGGDFNFTQFEVAGDGLLARAVLRDEGGNAIDPRTNAATALTPQETEFNDLINPNPQTQWIQVSGQPYEYRQDFLFDGQYQPIPENLSPDDEVGYLITEKRLQSIKGLYRGGRSVAELIATPFAELTEAFVYYVDGALVVWDSAATSGEYEPGDKPNAGTDPGYFKKVSQDVVESDLLLGTSFVDWGSKNPKPGKIYLGDTWEEGVNPKLEALINANAAVWIPNIVQKAGTTYTLKATSDFIRPGTSGIGAHKDYTTGAPQNAFTVDGSSSNGTADGSLYPVHTDVRSGVQVRRSEIIGGDSETAPPHRSAFYGIYGDIAQVSARTDLVPVEDAEVVLIDEDAVNGTFYPFSTGETWAQIKSSYVNLRFDFNTSDSGINRIIPHTKVISPQLLQSMLPVNGFTLLDQNGVLINLDDVNDADTGLTYRQQSGDRPNGGRMQFRVTGIKAQKTVIASTLTITNPNESNSNAVLQPNGDGTATFKNLPADDFDDASPWEAGYLYTDEIFSFSPTQTTAEDIDGNQLEQGKTYLGRYRTPKTSHTSLTLDELKLIEIVSSSSEKGVVPWESAKAYEKDDVVVSSSRLWVALQPSTNIKPSEDDGTHWKQADALKSDFGTVEFVIDEYPVGGVVINNQTITTGIDMTEATKVVAHLAEDEANRSNEIVLHLQDGRTAALASPYSTWHVNLYVTNKATGEIRIQDVVRGQYLDRIVVYGKKVVTTVVEPSVLTITNPEEEDSEKVLMPNGDGTATFKNLPADGFDDANNFVALWQPNRAYNTSNVVIAKDPKDTTKAFFYTAKQPRPDTITAFSATEATFWEKVRQNESLKEFDSVSETNDTTFNVGELVITRYNSDGTAESGDLWQFSKERKTAGDYSNGVGYFTKVSQDGLLVLVLPEDGGQDPVHATFNIDNQGNGDIDIDSSYTSYLIRRHQASTQPQPTDIGLTIAADDFDWYWLRRLSSSVVEVLGKPFSSAVPDLSDLATKAELAAAETNITANADAVTAESASRAAAVTALTAAIAQEATNRADADTALSTDIAKKFDKPTGLSPGRNIIANAAGDGIETVSHGILHMRDNDGGWSIPGKGRHIVPLSGLGNRVRFDSNLYEELDPGKFNFLKKGHYDGFITVGIRGGTETGQRFVIYARENDVNGALHTEFMRGAIHRWGSDAWAIPFPIAFTIEADNTILQLAFFYDGAEVLGGTREFFIRRQL